ncbi:putative bifunctional diguanylate cyclase/phosphodiesterase [Quadrisphaera setariae]|uniref:Bifunctional diguanylate cyclase/phosphodiesterase n=1 Tax=Quadrisphaera setariae TaxID=2593304 RepID=A0A5C8Z5A0_9ACTN|nr:bifunctional diguanylate cyclase/phosphodiesterase [Quadrisphaera setariae]TXR52301.1 bifunctional diguanylate cyclase/phosphodiesterase [Quadrisphaera setariae]
MVRAGGSAAASARRLLRGAAALRPGVTRETLRATTCVSYASAAVLVLLGLAVEPSSSWRSDPQGVLALGALAVALAVALLGRRMPPWSYNATMVAGTAAIAAGVALSAGTGRAPSLAWLFAIAVVEAVYFFPLPVACLHVALVLSALVASAAGAVGVGFADLVLVGGSLLVVAVLVHLVTAASAAAGVDLLTGLLDRAGTTRRMARAVALESARLDGLVLALVGLDGFARVNEVRGHAEGDALLRATAQRWRARLPEDVLLGRWSGDQFAVLVRGCTDQAWDLVQELRCDLPGGLRCSAGVAVLELGDELEDLVDHAEGALAAAKRDGGGEVRLWALGTPTTRGLLQALERGDVHVHYQPVVDLRTGTTTGAEALVRWTREDGSTVMPGDFLPQAEASGAVVQLGRHVVERACADAASWPVLPGRAALTVAVNASGPELAEADYATWVVAALHRAGLPGERLVVEVVEGVLDERSPVVAGNLHALRAAGVRIAVDDFGTGWSSMARLGQLPLDLLKVDRSFVAAVEPGREAPVCAGVIALAHALDLTIVAEGVETAHQAAWLAAQGCEEGQGWWWAPALPTGAFVARLEQEATGARADA